MRLRLLFAVTILVAAESLALASPSPVIPQAQLAVRDTIGELVVDAAIVWSAFVLAAVFISGLLATARLRRGRRPTLSTAPSPHSSRGVMPSGSPTHRAVARS